MKTIDQEEIYEEQITYLRVFHPNTPVIIDGYGKVNLDAISNRRDMLSLLKNFQMICPNCNKKVKEDNKEGWICVFRIPPNNKTIEMRFFCGENNNQCCVEWTEKNMWKEKNKK